MDDPNRQVGVRQVGVLGFGAIGSVVAGELAGGRVAGAALAGVALRAGRVGEPLTLDDGSGCRQAIGLDDLAAASDLVVEAAGQAAFAAIAPRLLDAGVDLLAVSTGALADPDFLAVVRRCGPGRLHLCSGAIGGLDLVRAAAAMGSVSSASITTTKKLASLVQDRMDDDEVAALLAIGEPTMVFDGEVADLVARFPQSTNVAATLALAVGSFDIVRGRVIADPTATLTTHAIEVIGAAGRYRFEIVNQPLVERPRSSAVVPWAVVRSLRDLCGREPMIL